MVAEAQRTVEKEAFREAGRSLALQGHVSHGFYPKLNGKAQRLLSRMIWSNLHSQKSLWLPGGDLRGLRVKAGSC